MARRNDGPIIRKPRSAFFPHGGNRNSEKHWNDKDNPMNRRRHHGTDPLRDGFDPGDNPLVDNPDGKPKDSGIPI